LPEIGGSKTDPHHSQRVFLGLRLPHATRSPRGSEPFLTDPDRLRLDGRAVDQMDCHCMTHPSVSWEISFESQIDDKATMAMSPLNLWRE
jgi:hypothetical protein